jgi:hypothetical protein
VILPRLRNNSTRSVVVRWFQAALLLGVLVQGAITLACAVPLEHTYIQDFIGRVFVQRTLGMATPDQYEVMLDWVAKQVPEHTVVVVMTGPSEDSYRFFRAVYALTPRTVWWATPSPWGNWHIETPREPKAFVEWLRLNRADYLLLDGIRPSDLPLMGDVEIMPFSLEPDKYSLVFLKSR